MKRRLLLLLACLLLVAPIHGEPVPGEPAAGAQTSDADAEAVRTLHTGFFEGLRQGGVEGAIAHLRQTGGLDPRALPGLERRLRTVETDFGRPDGYALVNETEIPHAPRFHSAVFLTFHDSGSVAWRLRFYRRVTGVWIISTVQVETEFVEDFVRLGEVEFSAYRAVLDRLPTKAELERMLKDSR